MRLGIEILLGSDVELYDKKVPGLKKDFFLLTWKYTRTVHTLKKNGTYHIGMVFD